MTRASIVDRTPARPRPRQKKGWADREPAYAALGHGVTAATMTMTPEVARRWLDVPGTKNRHVRPTILRKYVLAMAGRRWVLNGEPIILDKQGRVLDGQHRLLACIESTATFPTVVVRGVDAAAFATLDTGRSRQAQDVLSIEGYPHPLTLGGIANFLWEVEVNRLPDSKDRSDHTQVAKLVHDNPGLISSAAAVRGFRWRPLKNATFGLFHFLAGRVDPKARDEFFDHLSNGVGLTKGSPILLLRHRLEETWNSRKKSERTQVLAITIKAWNAWRSGKPIGLLAWKSVEPLPTLA
jgi:hypothetical protein